MNNYSLQVEKEAYEMVKRYGKNIAKNMARGTAEMYNEDIKKLKLYDPHRINHLQNQMFFWADVARCIDHVKV